jgi:RNA polymerase sigma-70 factor, ECF subfamily
MAMVTDVLVLSGGQLRGGGDEEAALVLVASTEPEAFAELCNRYSGRLYSYLRARTDSDDDAADLAQQVFVRAMDALPRYRHRGVPFGAWLFRIARNLLIDTRRRGHATLSLDLLPQPLTPAAAGDLEANVIREEARARVRAMLGDLKAEEREMILLRFVAGLTFAEIGVVMGKSESTVHRHVGRSLRNMQERYRVDE